MIQEKYNIALNIGYKSELFNGGIITDFPIVFDNITFKEFKEVIRRDIKNIFNYAIEYYVPPSSLHLFITIVDNIHERQYAISMKNVKGYQELIDDYILKKQQNDQT